LDRHGVRSIETGEIANPKPVEVSVAPFVSNIPKLNHISSGFREGVDELAIAGETFDVVGVREFASVLTIQEQSGVERRPESTGEDFQGDLLAGLSVELEIVAL
jgi:hypothetical protein